MFHCLPSTHLLVTDLGRNPVWTNLAYLSTPHVGLARGREPQKSMPLDTDPTKPISFVHGVLEGLHYRPPIHLPTYPPPVGELAVLEIVYTYTQFVLVVDHFLNPAVARVFTDNKFDDISPRYDMDGLLQTHSRGPLDRVSNTATSPKPVDVQRAIGGRC